MSESLGTSNMALGGLERMILRISGAAAAFAIALLALVIADGPLSFTFAGQAILMIDIPAAIVIVLTSSVGLVVMSFAGRYLGDEAYRGRFFVFALIATSGAVFAVAAAGPIGFTIGWVLSGAALSALVTLDRRSPASGPAVLAVTGSEAISGVALVGASAIAISAGAGSFSELAGSGLPDSDAGTACAILLLAAVLARCAQFPYGAWLQRALSAPTPVSALMHAGLVNAGAIVLIRWEPVFFADSAILLVLFAAAALTIAVGTAAMLARPDIKGSLALSTRAQMGFMLIQCSLGAFAGALFHLVAHGMYKAALFLGAGQAIDEQRARLAAPPARQGGRPAPTAVTMSVSAIAPLIALTAAVAVFVPSLAEHPGQLVLIAFAWSTAAQSLWWWLRLRRAGAVGTAAACVVVGAGCALYVGAFAAFEALVGPALPEPAVTVPAWLVLPLFAALAVVTSARWLADANVLREPDRDGALGRLYRAVYAGALDFGNVGNSLPRPARRRGPAREVRA